MIDKLIEEGKALESKAGSNGDGGKSFRSGEFEKWVATGLLYLEKKQPNSVLTEKAKNGYKSLDVNSNFAYYQFLLAALEATKELEEHEARELAAFTSLDF